MKITINEKEYEVKYNLRAMLLFEQIANKAFEIKTMFDEYVLFYASILGANKECDLDFDVFIEWAEENPNALNEFTELIIARRKKNELLQGNKEGESEEKKANL